MHMTRIGLAVVRLGGGRFRAEDTIDHSVGLSGLRSTGEFLHQGEEMLMIHARNDSDWSQAEAQCRTAIEIAEQEPDKAESEIVLDRIKGAMENKND